MFVALAVMVSTYGWIAGDLVISPRIVYAFAATGDAPEALAKIHPRFHTPVFAIVLYAAVTWLLAVTGTFLWVAAVSAASSLVLYSAVCASLIRLRQVRPDANALRISFGPALAVASIAISLALISALNLRQAGLMGFTALMATANWWWAKRQESKTASKIAVASLP